MRYKTLVVILLILGLIGCKSLGHWYSTTPQPQNQLLLDIESGFQAERIRYNGMVYDIVIIDPQKIRLNIAVEYNGNGIKVSDFIEEKGKDNLLFLTNGGMFTQDRKALGYLSINSKMITKLNERDSDYGNFYLKPNGVFFIHNSQGNIIETSKFNEEILNNEITPYLATQSGPMLLENGNIHSAFNKGSKNKFIRNGVGIIKETSLIVFAISNRPVNFYDFSSFFKNFLECDNALYLDGKVSTMYIPELNRAQFRGPFGPVIYATSE